MQRILKSGVQILFTCGLILFSSSVALAGPCDAEGKLSLNQLADAFRNFDTLSDVRQKNPTQLPQYTRKYICNIQQAISLQGFLKRKNVTGHLDKYTRTAIANFLECFTTLDNLANGYEPNSTGPGPDQITLNTIEENFEAFDAGYGMTNMGTCQRKYQQDTTVAQSPPTPTTPPSPTIAPTVAPATPPAPTVIPAPVSPTVPAPKAVIKTNSKTCRNPATLKNRDIIRNRAKFKKYPHLCITIKTLNEHGVKWVFYIITNTKHPNGPTWSVPHDNENSAFNAGLSAIITYGGKLVAINSGGRRHHSSGQDPNRNFGTSAGRTRSCTKMRRKPSPKFTRMMMSFYSGRHPYLTLHNNTNGGGISAGHSSAVMRGLMSKTPRKGLADPDDAILIGGLTSFKKSASAKRAVKFFHKRGVNVIYEHIRSSRSDCSMSNYVLLNRLGNYYNIEAQHKHTNAQNRMVKILMNYLGIKPL